MAANDDVKLLGYWTSPYVARARIALNIKSVSYEFISVNYWVGKNELLLKSNPVHKKVPVLFHGDKIVCESLIILEYVDEIWSSGPTILPSDPYDRATARFWAAFVDQNLLLPTVSYFITNEPEEEEQKARIEKLHEGLKLLEDAFKKCSEGNKFFGGDKIGYLDIVLGSWLGWLRMLEKLLKDVKILHESVTPALHKWAQDFYADAAVQHVMPDIDKMVEFGKDTLPRCRARVKAGLSLFP